MTIPQVARDLPDDQVFVDPAPSPAPPAGQLPSKRIRAHRGQSLDLDDLTLVEYALRDPLLYDLADAIPVDGHRPGRKHAQPVHMNLVFSLMACHYRTVEATQRHFANRHRWGLMGHTVAGAWPHDLERHLPDTPMTADAYFRFRNTYLLDDDDYEVLHAAFCDLAARVAQSMGYFDPAQVSPTHPAATNTLFGDGKQVRAMFRALPGDRHVDPITGAIEPRRSDPDSRRYTTTDGVAATGIPWVYLECRRPLHRNERLVLDFDAVAPGSDEMAVAMILIERTRALLPAAEAIVWDGAMRGVHMRDLIAQHGLIPVNKSARKPDASWHRIRGVVFTLEDGTQVTKDLWLIKGTPSVQVTVQGQRHYVRGVRTRTTRREHQSRYEISSEYVLPDHSAVTRRERGATFRLRHDTTAPDDLARGFGLNENLRIIDPMDADFDGLYGLRNNAENLNRRLEDTLWAGRARSVTIAHQRVDHLGYALYNNLLARIAHERRTGTPAVAWLPSGTPQLAFAV